MPTTSLVTACAVPVAGGLRQRIPCATGVARHCTAMVAPPPAKPFRGNVTGFELLFRRSEEWLIETSFNGICSPCRNRI